MNIYNNVAIIMCVCIYIYISVCVHVCVCVCGGAWGVIFPLHCWFYFNDSETVKAITLEFSDIQELFIRNIWAKRGIPNFS